jgi:hypothetical protein
MTRADLQLLANTRVADAEALLLAGRWAGAYYLLGYAVECALKACAARLFKQDEVPEKGIVLDFYTHRVDKLVTVAGLQAALDARLVDAAFQLNWRAVRDWNEASRYNHTVTEAAARELHVAVTDPHFGVLPWLKTLW